MNILYDENIPAAEHYFSALGRLRKKSGRDIEPADLADVDVLLVRSVTRVDRDLLQHSTVRFVGSCTTGVDHIDREYLGESGISFAHAPGANAQSVVEYVLSALCLLSRQEARVEPGMSVGIVGLGNVGGKLYRLLDSIGFDCRGYDPLLTATGDFTLTADLEQALQADIVTLHTPLALGGDYPTRHMLNEARLADLPRDCLLLNTSRGAVVDNDALSRLLSRRRDLAVVLDVWEGEPVIDRGLLAQVELATSHIAGYSYDGKLRGTEMVCRDLCHWLGVESPAGLARSGSQAGVDLKDWPALCELALSNYDIAADDRRLRRALVKGGDTGAEFEALRRNYPQRRELGLSGVKRGG